MGKPIVLVHGAWHGPWCWDRVTPLLDAAGAQWTAVDLPSAAAAESGASDQDDALAVWAALDALPGDVPAILLGHSRGGRVISEAGTHSRVGHLVYLAAFLAEKDTSMATLVSPDLPKALLFEADGSSRVNPKLGMAVFYNDCSEDDFAWASAHLRAQSHQETITDSKGAWKTKPSTYVICSKDKAIPAPAQRQMAEAAATVIEWEVGHSPFANQPEKVAALLIELSRA
jgi:pimeloyl-ACP methyl ester carboxylesterase